MRRDKFNIFRKKKAVNAHIEPSYYNREISWLQFNERVLAEAANMYNPLLERLRFLSISASNLDEFRRVRIAGLKSQIVAKVTKKSSDGLNAQEQLKLIDKRVKNLIKQQNILWQSLKYELAAVGIYWGDIADLSSAQKKQLKKIFNAQLKPHIFSHKVDEQMPIPFIPNEAIAILCKYTDEKDKDVFYLHRLSRGIKPFIHLKKDDNSQIFFFAEDVSAYFLGHEYAELSLQENHIIRVLRDGDLALEEHAEDLYLTFENALTRRRSQAITTIEYKGKFNNDGLGFWASLYNIERKSFSSVKDMPVGLSRLSALIDNRHKNFLFPPYRTYEPRVFKNYKKDIFALIKQKDKILHHPYEKFDPVVELLKQAARDEQVVEIYQTLYRTSHQSPIVDALEEAASLGKRVTVMIELKARFDEENNLKIARRLDNIGAHVLLGQAKLKTHAKLCLVKRREGEDFAYYSHLGTGNYHPITAKIYTDLSLFTRDADIGQDIIDIFAYMEGSKERLFLKKLSYAPHNLGGDVIVLIDQEIKNAKKGKPAYIWAKMNSLLETDIIDKLYEASQAGVKITLNIRGICALKAGIKGLSENIQVFSVIGRFLEHSRVFIFAAGDELKPETAKIYISSADWMFRNIHRRIEVMVPIESLSLRKYILKKFMAIYNQDEGQSWWLQPCGEYTKITSASKHPLFCQQEFIKIATRRGDNNLKREDDGK